MPIATWPPPELINGGDDVDLMHPPMTAAERRKAWPWLSDAQARELEGWLRQRDGAWLAGAEPPPGPPPWPLEPPLPFTP